MADRRGVFHFGGESVGEPARGGAWDLNWRLWVLGVEGAAIAGIMRKIEIESEVERGLGEVSVRFGN